MDRLQASSYRGSEDTEFVGASLLAISGFLHQDFEFDGVGTKGANALG